MQVKDFSQFLCGVNSQISITNSWFVQALLSSILSKYKHTGLCLPLILKLLVLFSFLKRFTARIPKYGALS